MKKRRLSILISIIILTLVFQVTNIYAATLSSNILLNSDFESGMTNWVPKHVGNASEDRILGTTGGNASVVNGIGRNGSKALKIVQGNQIEGGALTAWARAEQFLLSKETPKVGSAYLFSTWVKAESIPSGITPSVQVILELGADQGEQTLHYQDEVLASETVTTEWKKITGVTRIMSFEQQDSPNSQYKGMIGLFSSPKYAGANTGFDQGIKQDAQLKEFNAFAILAPGPTQAVPLIFDDMEILKPVYNFIFDKPDADSKLLYKESGSTVYTHQGTNIAVYRDAKDEAYFTYKLDFNSSAKDAILSLNLADDYKIEIATSENGSWTTAATGKKLMAAGAYKADEVIDLTSYLGKNSENSVYVKFSDNTPGSTGTAKNGLMLRALEVFSKTGELEFKLNNTTSSSATSSQSNGTSSSKTSSAATSNATNSTETSDAESDISSNISSEAAVDDGVKVDSAVIKSVYTDVVIDYTSKKVSINNKLTIKELLDSFKLGTGYTFKITDKDGKEITDVNKAVNSSMLIQLYKNSEKYTSLKVNVASKGTNILPMILIIIFALLALAAATLLILYKKGIIKLPKKM